MKRILTIVTAAVVAAAPALALGIPQSAHAAAPAPSRQVQPVDDTAGHHLAGDDRVGHHQAEPGDDRGRHGGRQAEPGDDSRARPVAPRPVTVRAVAKPAAVTPVSTVARADDKGGSRHVEPGDDKGGRHAEPGDDRGRGHHAEPGDDKGHR